MVKLEWDDKMDLGIIELDLQHRNLINIINYLNESKENGTYKKRFKYIIRELERFLVYHFNTEETLFEKYNYIDKKHLEEHKEMLEGFPELKEMKPTFDNINNLIKQMYYHLYHHTLTIDKRFAEFLKNNTHGRKSRQ